MLIQAGEGARMQLGWGGTIYIQIRLDYDSFCILGSELDQPMTIY